MNNLEITRLLKTSLSDCFKGTFALDKIPEQVLWPAGLVFNTQVTGVDGHWTAVFITDMGDGFFFDSAGVKPMQSEIKNFLHNNTLNWYFSTKRIQASFTTTCGLYVIGFLIAMAQGSSLQQFLNQFTDDFAANDIRITDTINKLFNTKFKAIDTSFITPQLQGMGI